MFGYKQIVKFYKRATANYFLYYQSFDCRLKKFWRRFHTLGKVNIIQYYNILLAILSLLFTTRKIRFTLLSRYTKTHTV